MKSEYDKSRTAYVHGSAAKKMQTKQRVHQEPYEIKLHKKEQPVVSAICAVDCFLLALAIAATMFVCISYLSVRSEVTTLKKNIEKTEKEIAVLTRENDALESAMLNESIDMDYVYRVAVGVLGMVYPNNNEIIYYEYDEEGYYRQYNDIPES